MVSKIVILVSITLIYLSIFFGAAENPTYIKIVDSSVHGNDYAYAPSIIKKDGIYHVFFCSIGANGAWDYIRYTNSSDGINWSDPMIKLKAVVFQDPLTGKNTNYAACDPSVVYYQGYYYLYYSNAYQTGASWDISQTVVSIARSTSIDGQYLTYTERGTWEDTPNDSKMIILPLIKHTQNLIGYGAGQQTLLVRDNKLLMWYTDDSIDPSSGTRTYMLESTNPVQWSPDSSREINIKGAGSIDVKYDSIRNAYMMTDIANDHTNTTFLRIAFSSDGLNWSSFTTIVAVDAFPYYTHNVGVSGDEVGTLLADNNLIAFGAPYDLSNDISWGKWDLYGEFVPKSTFLSNTTTTSSTTAATTALFTTSTTYTTTTTTVPTTSTTIPATTTQLTTITQLTTTTAIPQIKIPTISPGILVVITLAIIGPIILFFFVRRI